MTELLACQVLFCTILQSVEVKQKRAKETYEWPLETQGWQTVLYGLMTKRTPYLLLVIFFK